MRQRLTDEQREVVIKRNKGARADAHDNSIKEWYYWHVSCDRLLSEKQLFYSSVLGGNSRLQGRSKDLQNTWQNLTL